MKEETLEEAAERISKTNSVYETAQDDFYHGFIEGAKWQQERMHSEEEVKMLAFNFYYDMSHTMGVAENLISENATNVDVWFKQFKKK